jgi:molybdopterin molybdotransferase
VKAQLVSGFGKKAGPVRFVWAHCWQQGKSLVVDHLTFQGNGMLKSAIAANALIIVPENSPLLPAGSEVEVMLLGANNFL